MVAFLWPGSAQLWRTRGSCHCALMVASAWSRSTDSSCVSVVVSLPAAAQDRTNLSAVMLKNVSI